MTVQSLRLEILGTTSVLQTSSISHILDAGTTTKVLLSQLVRTSSIVDSSNDIDVF